MTYTYIKRSKGLLEFDFELDPESYRVGSTWQDYNNGYWVIVTPEMLEFREANPGCSYQEMLNLRMNEVVSPPEPTEKELADRARSQKLRQINEYDSSTNVNSFILNGEIVWLDKATRVALIKTVEIEKTMGREITTLWMNDKSYTMPVDLCIQMLYQLELYALDCYNKTAEHKVAVKALETREEIENYDHTLGYPEKINLDLSLLGA